MPPPLDPIPRPPLERAAALSAMLSAAEQQHRGLSVLPRTAEDHALTVFHFVREIADGGSPDPSPILRSRGRVEALVQELLEQHDAEREALAELRVALVDAPDADSELEARAMASLRARLGRAEAATDARTPAAGPEGLK
jgi:hypothetical protein